MTNFNRVYKAINREERASGEHQEEGALRALLSSFKLPLLGKSGEPIESLGILKYKALIIIPDQKALRPSDIDSFIKLPI